MFVATFDDRHIMPEYISSFILNTTRFCDLHLISPAKNLPRIAKDGTGKSQFNVHRVDTLSLPGYQHVQQLFNSMFINYSTNRYVGERACFHRWFALNAATTDLQDNDYVCLLDSDFLIGIDPVNLLSLCKAKARKKDISFIAEWTAEHAIGPELTIMTKSYLFGFCKYLLTDYYASSMKSQLHGEYFDCIGNGRGGGICDMRALATYATFHQRNIFNLRRLKEVTMVYNVNEFLESKVGQTDTWKIVFQPDSQTMQVANKTQKLVGSHFQGGAKTFMNTAWKNKQLSRDICMEHVARERTFYRKSTRLLKGIIKQFCKMYLRLVREHLFPAMQSALRRSGMV